MERLMSPSKVRAPAKVWQTKAGAIGEIDAKPKLHQSRSGANSEVFGVRATISAAKVRTGTRSSIHVSGPASLLLGGAHDLEG